MRKAVRLPQSQDDTVLIEGGMDQVTPLLKVHPGSPRRMVNYEWAISGGVRRVDGYERFDGKLSPSSVTFRLVPIQAFSTVPTVGQTLLGTTSGTSATIIVVTATYLAVSGVTGLGYQAEEAVTVAGVVIGLVGTQVSTISTSLKKQYVNLAADVYRALIAKVPGVGPVRGVFGATFNGAFAVYAIRDRATDLTKCVMYKTTPSGWEVAHGYPLSVDYYEVNFRNGGLTAPVDNSPFTYLTSTPTLYRAVLTGGSWAAGTATGKLIYKPDSLVLTGAITIGTTTLTCLSSTEPGGGSSTYEFDSGGIFHTAYGNVGGQLEQGRIYGCDGVNRAWEFDGTLVVPIDANLPAIASSLGFHGPWLAPSQIAIHHNHLVLGIKSSVQISGVGTPFDHSATAGGVELTASDLVTGFSVLPGSQASGAMAVFGRNRTAVLYGTAAGGSEPFELVGFETETGAIASTNQRLDRVYYLDDRGVIDLKAAQEYGNFTTATVTRTIQPYIAQKHGRVVASCINREKGQYRLFFNDGTGLFITFDNGKRRGAAPMSFPHPMSCAWSGEDAVGFEVTFVGSTDGYVYQFDRGTSFDGEAIDTEIVFPWNHMKTPRQRKTLKRASIEIQDSDYTELRVGVRRGPHLTDHLQDAVATHVPRTELEMQWDHFVWSDFYWDAHRATSLELDVKGTAERVQYAISSGTDYLPSYSLTSIVTSYFKRRAVR